MKKVARLLVLLLTSIVFALAPAGGAPEAAAGPSEQEVQNTTSGIISDLRDKLKKLNYINRNYDSSVDSLTRALETLVTILDGMNYRYDPSLGGTAYYPKTGAPGDWAHNTIYLSGKFFDRGTFGAGTTPQMDDRQKSEADRKLLVSQAGVLLHEGVHADQNLQFKTLQALKGVLPLPGLGDRAEGEGYLVQYLLLRAIGGDGSWSEVRNALEGVKENYTRVYKFDDLKDLERFHKKLGLDGAFRLLDGGVDKAYGRLKKYESILPAGKNTRFRLSFRLVDEQGRPVAGYPVRIEAFNQDPEFHVLYSNMKGEVKTGYYSWTELAKTFIASANYAAYLQYESGQRVLLCRFTGESLFDPGLFKKDGDGYYSIDLGTAGINGAKPGNGNNGGNGGQNNEVKEQKSSLRLNLLGPDGNTLPAGRVAVAFADFAFLKDGAAKVIERASWYAGKLAGTVTAAVLDEKTNTFDHLSRTVVSDGGEMTVAFTPMPELPRYGDGWNEGWTEEAKMKRLSNFSAVVRQAGDLFRQALENNGIAGSGGPGYTLGEYQNRLMMVEVYYPGYAGDPALKKMWDDMLQRQYAQASLKARSTLDYLKERNEEKERIQEDFLRDGFHYALSKLTLPKDILAAGRYDGFWFGGGQSREEMDAEIEAAGSRYDAAIKRLVDYLQKMGGFFNDAELWKSYARYRDLYSFLPADTELPGLYEAGLDKLLDTYMYEVYSYYLDDLVKSRELVIRAMEESRDGILEEKALEEVKQSLAAGSLTQPPDAPAAGQDTAAEQQPAGPPATPAVTPDRTDARPPVEHPVQPPVEQPEELPVNARPPVNERPPAANPPGGGREIPVVQQPPAEARPGLQPVVYKGADLQWDEWTVRAAGPSMPVETDIRKKEDSPWSTAGGVLSYTDTGTQLYRNDFVITQKEFDVSDILVTFEATGTFRTDYGYTGPVIAFTRPESIYNGILAAGTIGAGGSYCWEAGRKDRGLVLYDYKNFRYYPEKFIDHGDNAFRSYTMRVKDGRLTVTLPEGATYTADVPETKNGLRLPLAVSMRQYDRGKQYSVVVRNLTVIEHPR